MKPLELELLELIDLFRCVRELLDAQTFIETRVSAGSVSPTEVARQVEDVAALLKAHGEWLTRTRTHNETAMKKLRLRARQLGGA